ncbi:hypothetical protein Tco_0232766 [Tanacetum coccineum]
MMRLNEVHKFNDGTLMRIRDKLDFMVKDFKLFEYNKGMEKRIWSEDDKRRSEDFIEVIEKRLKIRRIFRSLKRFVGGRLRDINYRLINKTEYDIITPIMRFMITSPKHILVILPELSGGYEGTHNEDGNPARANIKQALSSTQDGNRLQDDKRLCLADDLKKSQNHNQRQVKMNKLNFNQKITTTKYKITNEESKVYELYTRSI